MRAAKTETGVRQEQIAQAALDILAAKGIHALSIAEIARQVGFVASAVYRHYPGKEHILDAVLDLVEKRLTANVEAVLAETTEPLERLRRLVVRHARLMTENQALPYVILTQGVFSENPGRRARLRQIMGGYLARVMEQIRAGQKAGVIRRELAPETVALLMMGLVIPAVVLRRVRDGEFDVLAHLENAWPLFCRAVAVPGGTGARKSGKKGKTILSGDTL